MCKPLKAAQNPYEPVLKLIREKLESREAIIVAIDGRCGSGKTYLAELIKNELKCAVLHMDDFYLPWEKRREDWKQIPGGNIDFDRFLAEALRPAREGSSVLYRPFQCHIGQYSQTVNIPACELTVVEGSYSHHPALADMYDLKLLTDCSGSTQRERLKKREGERFAMFEHTWIPLEEAYLKKYNIESSADRVINTDTFSNLKI